MSGHGRSRGRPPMYAAAAAAIQQQQSNVMLPPGQASFVEFHLVVCCLLFNCCFT